MRANDERLTQIETSENSELSPHDIRDARFTLETKKGSSLKRRVSRYFRKRLCGGFVINWRCLSNLLLSLILSLDTFVSYMGSRGQSDVVSSSKNIALKIVVERVVVGLT